MKSREAMLRIAGLYLLTLLSLDVLAQTDSTLDQAYDLLAQNRYQLAANAANAYLAGNPRRYRAEFIVAVAECSLHKGQRRAMQRMAALKRDYDLTGEAQRQVEDWVEYCAPPDPQQKPPGVVSSSITQLPQITSAAANKPNGTALPTMSALVVGTSYSGDDYTELKGIATADDCSRACRLQAPCRSMTYAKSSKTCWLKRSVPPAQRGDDFVSAVKRAN
jgi:hypothetical protein